LLRVLAEDAARAQPSVRTHPAWAELSERIRHIATLFIRRFDAWSVDADDVAQDVLLRLHSADAIRRLSLAGSPQGYLSVVVRNRVLDELRKNQSRWRGSSAAQQRMDEETGSGVSAEERIVLERLLESLSDEERELVRLRFWEGYSIEDIAVHLGVRYSTASVRLFRLMRRLREQMEGWSE
jgi:RNA polymerase sigma-70 factor, ECF subfamily